MNKIACIGDKSSVLCYMSVGFTVFVANTEDEAKKILKQITTEPCEYGIIFVTEPYYISLGAEIADFNDKTVPAIISVPAKIGSLGTGAETVKKLTEKAIGADIALY